MLVLVASVVGGVLLWKGRRSGVLISRVIQALQILQVQVGGVAYGLIVGAGALITGDGGVIGFKVQYGSSIEASWRPDFVGFSGAFNVLALALLVILVAPADAVPATMKTSPGEPERSGS
jgi:hypothetical protein